MFTHALIPQLLHAIGGGALALTSASLAGHYGYRSADRLPGESRKPECVYCLSPLQWHEIFPLFGWLLRPEAFRLPCPCGQRVGLWPQPLAEIVGFLLGFAAILLAGWSWTLAPLCLALGLLPSIALIDLAFGLIPDELNLSLGALGLVWLCCGQGDVFMGIVTSAGLLGFGLLMALGYSKWRGREMLGLGDVKFFAAAGLWLALMVVPWFLAVAGVIGVVIGLIWQRCGGGREFPFAPALCLSLAGCLYYQLYAPPQSFLFP